MAVRKSAGSASGKKKTTRRKTRAKSESAPARKKAAKPRAAAKPAARTAAKPARKAAAKPRPKAAARAGAKPTATPKGAVPASAVHVGHVFALRPRVSTTFKQSDFLTARHLLQDETYASIDEAARAVAEKALSLTNEAKSKRGFKPGR